MNIHRSLATAIGVLLAAVGLVGFAAVSPVAAAPKLQASAVHLVAGKTDTGGVACAHGSAPARETCEVTGFTSGSAGTLSLIHDGVPGATSADPVEGTAISCPSATVCVVAGATSTGAALEWLNAGKPTATEPVHGASNLSGVSCESATTCVAVGYRNGASTPTGTIQYGEIAVVKKGSSAKAKRVVGASQFGGVACANSTSCVLVGFSGISTHRAVVVDIHHTHIGGIRHATGSVQLNDVSCGSATTCWATGESFSAKKGVLNVIVRIHDGKPGHPLTAPQTGGPISCVTATTCYFAGGTSQYGKGKVFRFTNGHVTASIVIKGIEPLTGISCPVATSCVATGPTSFHPGPNYYYRSGVVRLTV